MLSRKAQDYIGIAIIVIIGSFFAFVAGANLAMILR